MKLQRLPTLTLAACTIAADLTIVFSVVPLTRASLLAARQDASEIVLFGLLIANFALLALTILAMWMNGTLILRMGRNGADHRERLEGGAGPPGF